VDDLSAAIDPDCPGCRLLKAELELQRKTIASLLERVRQLEARLGQDSSNSSKPPSSDPPWKERQKRKPGGGRRGGQPGHPGKTRELVPEEELAGLEQYDPDRCACGVDLGTVAVAAELAPRRHQVWDLPVPQPVVVEHRCRAKVCPCCGESNWGKLPPEVPRTGQGPQLEATIGLLTGVFRLSRGNAALLLREVWGVPICKATISQVERRLTGALAATLQELATALGRAWTLHVDETSWFEGGKRLWLWMAVSAEAVLCRIDPERSREAFGRLLGLKEGRPSGTDPPRLVTDRYGAYLCWPRDRHQHCNGHILRDLEGAVARGAMGATFARDRLKEAFGHWKRFKLGEIDRERFQEETAVTQQGLLAALRQGESQGDRKFRGLCRTLQAEWDRMWVYLNTEGVEPTNNAAEQAIRPAVLWRKTSYGSQSERGRRYAEAMLSVTHTARKNGINILHFLTAAARAAVIGVPAPQLTKTP